MKSWAQALNKTECGGPGVYLQQLEVEQEGKKFKVVVVWMRNAFHWLRHLDHWWSSGGRALLQEGWHWSRFWEPCTLLQAHSREVISLLPALASMPGDGSHAGPFLKPQAQMDSSFCKLLWSWFLFFFFFHRNRKGIDAEVIRSMKLGWPPRDSVSMQNQTATKNSLWNDQPKASFIR